MTIRIERPGDESALRDLLVAAFDGQGEADLVEALRRDGDVVLSLVSEDEAGVVDGMVLFSRATIEHDASAPFPALALAPMAVRPDRQRRGIGSALIGEAHRRLMERGESLSVVLGDPAYYGRFGYEADRACRFDSPWAGRYLQALAFSADAPARGRLMHAPAFAALV